MLRNRMAYVRLILAPALTLAACLATLHLTGCKSAGPEGSSWRPSWFSWGSKQDPAAEGQTFTAEDQLAQKSRERTNPVFSD